MLVTRKVYHVLIATFLSVFLFTGTAIAVPPGFAKQFIPDTIGPGSVSTLTFTITNPTATPLTGIGFTDTLPAGVFIADPANVSITCHPIVNEVLSAPEGGSTITLTDLNLAGNGVCIITVDVTSSTVGTHTNNTGTITSNDGSGGVATDDLTVDASRPGFSKSFSPARIPIGTKTTLTFTIDNSANNSPMVGFSFSDPLPAGLAVADPANLTVTGFLDSFSPTVTAVSGTGIITCINGALSGGGIGTISVDVLATIGGATLVNATSDLIAFSSVTIDCGKATAGLDVFIPQISFFKSFIDDPVPPGGAATLAFTLKNNNRAETLTGITFTDDLESVVTGLVADGIFPMNDVCGAGSMLDVNDDDNLLILTGGSLDPAEEVTFNVRVSIPAEALAGVYANTTSELEYMIDGDESFSPAASDNLLLYYVPVLTKTFIDDAGGLLTDPVGPGGMLTVRFTVTNPHPTADATDIAFTDDLTAFMTGVTVNTLPANGSVLGSGSIFSTNFINDHWILSMTGGSLAAGSSESFDISLNIPTGVPANTYTNITSALTCTLEDLSVAAPPAVASAEALAAPVIRKSFTDDPVDAGESVTLEFTIENPNGQALTDISFTDDLDTALTGLVSTSGTLTDVCGAGSLLSGSSVLTLTGGSLPADETATFSVTLAVPPAAAPGSHTNITSSITANAGNLLLTGNPASDDLMIAGLTLAKEFIGDPVVAGDTAMLRFTITNDTENTDFNSISFTDDLDEVIPGLAAEAPLPVPPCGGLLTGTDFLNFTGGSLTAGSACTFDVAVRVPSGTGSGSYANTTSILWASDGATSYQFTPARDTLVVDSDIISLTKSFTNDPVSPGGTVALEFTVTNLSTVHTISEISFTDDLDAALAGLVSTSGILTDVCGAGSKLSGTSILTFSGGTLAPGASAVFSVTLNVPAVVPLGASIINTTSQITGTMVSGLGVNGLPARDTLKINTVVLTKSFEGDVIRGGQAVLTFTLENMDPNNAIDNIAFSDDLDAFIPGAAAVGLPMTVCETAQVAGTSLITFSNGSLAPGASCAFDVTVQIPESTPVAAYVNTTGTVMSGGLMAGEPAGATLSILEIPPGFSKVFAPESMNVNDVSTLTFTFDNTGSTADAVSLDFTDPLPAGLVVADPANVTTSCTGGTVTAVPGAGVIIYTGGSVAAGSTCTLSVDVASTVPGNYLNTTGDLTSSLGNSGTAQARLEVVQLPPPLPAPGFSKVFAPETMNPNDISTLTFTIDNTGSTADAVSLDFTDPLPAGLVVADPANVTTSCTGGTVTAVPGAGVIIYTGGSVAAGATCTLSVDVTSADPGSYLNTTGDLTSSLGNSGSAEASLEVNNLTPIPTVSEWGMIVFALLLVAYSVYHLRKSQSVHPA